MRAYRLAMLALGMMAAAAFIIPQTLKPVPYTRAALLSAALPDLTGRAGEGCVLTHASTMRAESCTFDDPLPLAEIGQQLERQGWKAASSSSPLSAWCKADQELVVEGGSRRVVLRQPPPRPCT